MRGTGEQKLEGMKMQRPWIKGKQRRKSVCAKCGEPRTKDGPQSSLRYLFEQEHCPIMVIKGLQCSCTADSKV